MDPLSRWSPLRPVELKKTFITPHPQYKIHSLRRINERTERLGNVRKFERIRLRSDADVSSEMIRHFVIVCHYMYFVIFIRGGRREGCLFMVSLSIISFLAGVMCWIHYFFFC